MKKLSLLFLFSILVTSAYSQKILDQIKEGNYEKAEKWVNKSKAISKTYKKESLDSKDKTEVNVIEWAAFFNQTEIVTLFLSNKDKFTNFQDWINHALGASVHNCNVELTQKLIASGAKPIYNCRLCKDASPLGIAIAYECMDVYQLLEKAGAPLISKDSGYDLIHAAAGYNNLNFLKDLVENKNLDINQKGIEIAYPIIEAIKNGRIENIKYLISKGAKLDFISKESPELSLTALHYINDLPTFKLFEEIMTTNKQLSMEKADAVYPILMTIIESDNRDLFDYFVENYRYFLKTKNNRGQNAMFSLFDTEKETVYFFNAMRDLGVPYTSFDDYGHDLKYYAKEGKHKIIMDLLNKK